LRFAPDPRDGKQLAQMVVRGNDFRPVKHFQMISVRVVKVFQLTAKQQFRRTAVLTVAQPQCASPFRSLDLQAGTS
jgi:hypothetical protein